MFDLLKSLVRTYHHQPSLTWSTRFFPTKYILMKKSTSSYKIAVSWIETAIFCILIFFDEFWAKDGGQPSPATGRYSCLCAFSLSASTMHLGTGKGDWPKAKWYTVSPAERRAFTWYIRTESKTKKIYSNSIKHIHCTCTLCFIIDVIHFQKSSYSSYIKQSDIATTHFQAMTNRKILSLAFFNWHYNIGAMEQFLCRPRKQKCVPSITVN